MGLPNHLAVRIPMPSRLVIANWREYLHDYHDKQLIEYLEFGWPNDFTGENPPLPSIANHCKDPAHMKLVERYVEREVAYGALLGPFNVPPFTP